MILPLLLGFVLGAGAIIFALQNTSVVALTFLGWQFQSSLAMLIILATIAGALLGILFSLPSIIGRSLRVRALRKENKALREEAEELRKWGEETTAHYDAQVEIVPGPQTLP